ncbi:glycoside hydrolase superfamily [Leptodontidium sp. MPI-SDFR-AT-0119]|nr:glycoside hydrolase superfamily [Leptodontidium sp. MPI-SDFR-AT-0119]
MGEGSTTIDREFLVDKLSLSEASSLLSARDLWHTQGLPSLNIASLRVSDGPNGVRGIRTFNGSKTGCFPCASGLASTWDVDLLLEIGQEMGRQAKAKGAHLVLAPTINIHRSPLGGRNFEAFSEDPFLSGHLGSNLIQGLQGEGVGAVVKHFVCNDVETDRTKVDVIVQQRPLREIYLKPFEIVIRDAKPWAVMSSYNKVNGVHVSESKDLLDGVLRKDWGWDGVIMSDWWGTYSTVAALNATLDLEMPGPAVWRGVDRISRAISCGKLERAAVNFSAARILNLVEKVTQTCTPENLPEREDNSQSYRELNRRAAAAAVVLLKNEGNILPLRLKSCHNIAVIGPNATKDISSGGGSASVNAYYYVSAIEGLMAGAREVSPETVISFAQGCYSDELLPLLKTTTASGDKGLDIKLFPHPFDFDIDSMAAPAASITSENSKMFFFDCLPSIALPITWALCEGVFEPPVDGDYEFGVATTGRAKLFVDDEIVVDNWSKQQVSRNFFTMGTPEVRSKICLSASKSYKISIRYSCISSFPHRKPGDLAGGILRVGARLVSSNADLIKEAVQAASKSDTVILCLGTDGDRESEGFDRTHMSLPEEQNLLAAAILEANPRTIVVNFSGSPVEMPWASKAPAILQSWFLGSNLGDGIADILLGKVNPSAKLPVSFPISLKHNPSYGNFPGTNAVIRYDEGLLVGYRHYTTREVPTLFPFGHGLSYTTFDFSDLVTSDPTISPQGQNQVTLQVTNSGELEGDAVVQLYVSAPSASVFRPVRELQGFVKLHSLKPGESRPAKFQLRSEHLSYWDDAKKLWVVERGCYNILIGHSSENIVLRSEIMVDEGFESCNP